MTIKISVVADAPGTSVPVYVAGPRGVGITSTVWDGDTGILTITYTDASTEALDFSGYLTAAGAAQTASEAAQALAEMAQSDAETAEASAVAAQGASEAAQALAEAARDAGAASEAAAASSASDAGAAQTASEAAQAAAEIAEGNAAASEAASAASAALSGTKASESAGSAATAKVWADSALAVSGNSAAAYVASLPYTTAPVALDIAPCGVPEHIRLGWGMTWSAVNATGPWLGMFANEAAARADPDAVTGAVYQKPAGTVWSLSASSGETQVYRVGGTAMPRSVVAEGHGAFAILRDGTQPDAPVWEYISLTGLTVRDVKLVNGRLYIATSTGLIVRDCASSAPLASSVTHSASTTPAIINNSVNDIAVAVLPDAPYVNGVQVPTVAVATDGDGTYLASIIQTSGNIYDIGTDGGTTGTAIAFREDGALVLTRSDGTVYVWRNPGSIAADGVAPDETYTASSTPAMLGTVTKQSRGRIFGSTSGVTILARGVTQAAGMVRRVTDTYDTGMMAGDIRACLLVSTDATSLFGVSLVANGISPVNTTGWNAFFAGGAQDNSKLTASGGEFVIDSSNGNVIAEYAVATKIGEVYEATVEITSLNAGNRYWVQTSNTPLINGTVVSGPHTSPSSFEFLHVATATTTYIQIHADNLGTSPVVRFNNVSFKPMDTDRSGKGNHAVINGTVTRTPVATGSDLVAYSGFSASNYPSIPPDTDFDFGTGDACYSFWANLQDNSLDHIFVRGEAFFATNRIGAYITGSEVRPFVGNTILTGGGASFGVFDKYDIIRRNGVLEYWRSGVLRASTPAADSLTRSTAELIIGNSNARSAGDALTNGFLTLFRIGATAPSAEQIRRIYEVERKLFNPSAKCKLLGATVHAVERDPILNQYLVLTSGGLVTMDEWGSIISTDAALAGKTRIAQRDGLRMVN